MVSINYATREVSCKIVFYGPGLSGKTTNLQYVHQKVPSETKGKLISLATDADRTLYFDFLPINIGAINGFAAKFQLYTVPGQVYYNATRKLVLRGVDGLVFVADSQRDKMDENVESFSNLKENLAEYGYRLDEIPIVIQYNKQDLPGVMTPEEMRPYLNPHNWREFKASATEGFGVFDTLKCILKLVLDKAKTGGTVPSSTPVTTATATPFQPQSMPHPMAAASPSPPSQPITPPMVEPVRPAVEQPLAARQATVPTVPAPDYGAIDDDATPAMGIPLPPAEYQSESSPLNEPMLRSPVREEISASPPEPVHRPFPGNTTEDEIRMRQRSYRDTGPVSVAEAETHLQPNSNSKPAGAPKMEPSLKKAEAPHRKRSFFKRLFGLK